MFSAVSTASYVVGAWQKQVPCFRFLRGFWKASCWRHVRRKCYVKSPNQESYLFGENTISTELHDILIPLHTESDSCDRSGPCVAVKISCSWNVVFVKSIALLVWRLDITFFYYMPSVRSLPEATQKAKTRHLFLPFAHDIAGSWNRWKHGGAKCRLHYVDYNCFGGN